MDPLVLLRVVSRVGVFIPPPWGPLLAAAGQVLPLVQQGVEAVEAVNKADPSLMPHLQEATQQMFGANANVDPATTAKVIFAPQHLTIEERVQSEKAYMDRASGGPSARG